MSLMQRYNAPAHTMNPYASNELFIAIFRRRVILKEASKFPYIMSRGKIPVKDVFTLESLYRTGNRSKVGLSDAKIKKLIAPYV